MKDYVLNADFEEMLATRGVSRRGFLQLCGTIAAAAGVSKLTVPEVAHALEESVIGAAEGNLFPVIWIEGASCTGCTEAFAQIDAPDPATVVLEMISCNYNETLSFAAGHSMEEAKAQTIKQCAGKYVLVYEGALLEGWDGWALRVAEETGVNAFLEAAENAFGVVALGSCAVNGGWMGSKKTPAGAIGCQALMAKNGITTPVINIPGCPANPEWLVAVLVDVVMMGVLPELNIDNKPALIFEQAVHENCQRRGHFENGEFVYKFGSEEERRGFCLYAMGCRGPQTKANCGVVRYNHRRSWCIEAGSPCIGCCEADPKKSSHNWVDVNASFYERHRDIRIGNWLVQPRTIGLAAIGLTAAAVILHGFGMKANKRLDDIIFEDKREWDVKHPDQAIGDYTADRVIVHADGTEEVISAEEFDARKKADYENMLKKIGATAASAVVAGNKAKEDASEAISNEVDIVVDDAEAVDVDAANEVDIIVDEADAVAVDAVDEIETIIEEEIDELKGGQE